MCELFGTVTVWANLSLGPRLAEEYRTEVRSEPREREALDLRRHLYAANEIVRRIGWPRL